MSDYKSITCALHEQYQLAVLKNAHLDIVWVEEKTGVRMARVAAKDVFTRNKAEYFLGITANNEVVEIRLDRISHACWADDGSVLGDF